MLRSSTAKRVRVVFVALALTLLTNYAISFAAKSGMPGNGGGPPPEAVGQSAFAEP